MIIQIRMTPQAFLGSQLLLWSDACDDAGCNFCYNFASALALTHWTTQNLISMGQMAIRRLPSTRAFPAKEKVGLF